MNATATMLAVSRAAVADWRRNGVEGRRGGAPVAPCHVCSGQPPDSPEYSALFGYYLGDGCISRLGRTFSLRVACDAKYPGIIEDVATLIETVRGRGPVGRTPAPGCIARGLTGSDRRKKADALMSELPPDRVTTTDAAKVLEVFALIPDKYWGVMYGSKVNTADCPLTRQGGWLESQYDWHSSPDPAEFPYVVELLDAATRPPPPNLNWQGSNFNCLYRPVFMECFPGQFEPIISDSGRWNPVEPEQP
jgi:hypothetical protein